MSKQEFKTEVNQLLHLLIHSLYSHSEIFLRELISNSSDAIDKLKYLTLTDDSYKSMELNPVIDITLEEGDQKFIVVEDNGIGMNDTDLEENLGTIARSGTKNFLSKLSGDQKKDSNLIGQFGVGFYSVFMVADKVEVTTRKAGEDKAWKWTSDGKTGYSIEPAEKDNCGTSIRIYLNEHGDDYSSKWSIENVVKKYSNHIAFPINLHYEATEYEGEGDDKKEKKVPTTEQINSASALWKRNKNELTDEDYNEFYKNISNDTEDPLMRLHVSAEGTQEYTTLFFVPKTAPFDMYQADYQPGVKLYVKRVFITDDEKELMPTYLRFLRGVIDSEDLPLNVSREILQQNRVLNSIRTASVKKVLAELKKMSESNPEKYLEFITQYNRPLKEGMYSDYANKEALMELVRYKSTMVEGYTSLAEYKDRMVDDQKAIYYITGENEDILKNSPLLEAYKKKNIEVLIMDDELDEIVTPMIGRYADLELKAVNKSGSIDDLKSDDDKEKTKEVTPLLERFKKVLGDKVKDVVASSRLSDSPSCIVASDSDMTAQMQQMMRAMGQKDLPETKPILEINPNHEIVLSLKDSTDDSLVEDAANLFLDQALLVEGVSLKQPGDFVKRLNRVMSMAVK